jgi:hypothetical protein
MSRRCAFVGEFVMQAIAIDEALFGEFRKKTLEICSAYLQEEFENCSFI